MIHQWPIPQSSETDQVVLVKSREELNECFRSNQEFTIGCETLNLQYHDLTNEMMVLLSNALKRPDCQLFSLVIDGYKGMLNKTRARLLADALGVNTSIRTVFLFGYLTSSLHQHDFNLAGSDRIRESDGDSEGGW